MAKTRQSPTAPDIRPRLRRRGNWQRMQGRRRAPDVRFWEKVDQRSGQGPTGECWLWTAFVRPDGYGTFGLGTPGLGGKTGIERAHRVAYFLTHGRWPKHQALHHCDMRRCVRPEHLYDGDAKENVSDRWARSEPDRIRVALATALARTARRFRLSPAMLREHVDQMLRSTNAD